MSTKFLLSLACTIWLLAFWARNSSEHLGAAQAAYLRRDFETALRHYQAALPHTHDPGRVAFNQAAVLVRLRRWQEAIICYTQALEDARANRRVLSLYGRGTARLVLALEDQSIDRITLLVAAIADLRSCLDERPDFEDARYHLSLAEDLLARLKAEVQPTNGKSQPPKKPPIPGPLDREKPSPQQSPEIQSGLKPLKPFEHPIPEPQPIETSQHIRAGRGQLPAIPRAPEAEPLSPEDARAWIEMDWQRITRARAQRSTALPPAVLVKDW